MTMNEIKPKTLWQGYNAKLAGDQLQCVPVHDGGFYGQQWQDHAYSFFSALPSRNKLGACLHAKCKQDKLCSRSSFQLMVML